MMIKMEVNNGKTVAMSP